MSSACEKGDRLILVIGGHKQEARIERSLQNITWQCVRFPHDAERLRQCCEGIYFDLGQTRQFVETCLTYDAGRCLRSCLLLTLFG